MYNTNKSPLQFYEYGRNVQELIMHSLTIEDLEHRRKFIEQIIDMIIRMRPQVRNEEEYRLKVWGHVNQITHNQLTDLVPEGTPKYDEIDIKKAIPYPKSRFQFRHYGKNILQMIAKAVEIEDEFKRTKFTEIIGAYMKMSLKNWSGNLNSDETIRRDIEILSKGALSLKEDAKINSLISPRRNPMIQKRAVRGDFSNKNYRKSNSKRNKR